jgi:hypothetical protein
MSPRYPQRATKIQAAASSSTPSSASSSSSSSSSLSSSALSSSRRKTAKRKVHVLKSKDDNDVPEADDSCDVCGEIDTEDNQLILCDHVYENGKQCRTQVHEQCYVNKHVNVQATLFYCDIHRPSEKR